jgi:hypothetical protein
MPCAHRASGSSHGTGSAAPKHVTTAEVHTLVGVFRSAPDAYKAVDRLDHARVAPDHVSLIAGDAQLAADVGGRSLAIASTLGGMALGVLLAVFFIVGPAGSGWINPVGLIIGSVFVVGGLGFIGFVVGQALVVRTSHQKDYEHAVEEGGAVVAVSCSLDECDRARAVLRHVGAADIVDESDGGHL